MRWTRSSRSGKVEHMEDRDWVWVIILVVSQLLLWRIYSVALLRQRRKHSKEIEAADKALEWYESQKRIV